MDPFFNFEALAPDPLPQDPLAAVLPNSPFVPFAENSFCDADVTLSTLLTNGVPVLTALRITSDVVPNVIIKDAIITTREAVTDGKSIAEPLARSGLFPKLLIDLVRIGEETGDVPGALDNVATTYEKNMEQELRVMTNLIEPAMIIFMAVGVGGLLFSILQALFAITQRMSV